MNETRHAQVLDLGQRWTAAELSGDADARAALLADDVVLVGPRGFVLDEERHLGSRKLGDLKHASLPWQDVRIRLYGGTAVAIGSQTQRSAYLGRDASGASG
jgi:hypothetical protein